MHRQPHILIVDDDGFVRDSVEHIAKLLGYKITKATNGQEALEHAQKQIFDLILSDLYMPVMAGDELIGHIKAMPEYKNIPFIFLSGSTEHSTWIKNLNAGADDFITKPFDKKILALKLKSHIKRLFLRKELLKSNMEYNLSLSEGITIFCTSKNAKFQLDPDRVYSEVKIIHSSRALLENISKLNLWLVLIDDDAIGEFDINKIKLASNQEFSMVLLASKTGGIQQQIDQGIGNFILKTLPEELIYHQINAIISREIEIKSKYINAIKLAAENSPVRLNPKTDVSFRNYHIAVIHEPFQHIPGGDFYEIFSTPQDDAKIVILGDVMGKKWSAWFFVNAYLAYIRSTVHFLLNNTPTRELTASGLVEHLNQQISLDLQVADVFTTLSVIIIHPSGPLQLATAGAMKPLLYVAAEDSIQPLNITGMLLGVSEDTTYQQLELEMNPGDKLLFYSDGYTEVNNSQTGEMISPQAIESVFRVLGKKKTLPVAEIEKKLISDFQIKAFEDDRSLLLITKK
ncbi:MAG: fused response regulator/phosphatase [Bacteroidales bacterium]|jgi:CheY-like chemotaxis protein/serine phosphatase RsbU (regulator of sigma subunit)|nr:fused response regulator/phosphatase [Bacteroidales bacterium]